MPSYIRRTIGKVAGIASAVTLGILSYAAGPVNAAEAPKKFEDPNLVRIVTDSYRNAPKGKETDENIVQFMLGACQDPGVSRADFAYMIHTLHARVSDPQKRKELEVIENIYLETGKKEAAAKAAYALALQNASKKSGEDQTKALVFAAKTYYDALKKLEPAIEKTQYAQSMLEIAQRGLALAKKVPAIVETDNFKAYVAESKKSVAQAKKEEHVLSQILLCDDAIEIALADAEAQRTIIGKIDCYERALKALGTAEEVIPGTQFGAEKKQLEEVIKGLEKVTPPPDKPEKPPDKPEKPPEKPPEQPPEKPPEKGKGDVPPPKKDDDRPSLADIFSGLLGKRYNTFLEYRQGIAFEDKDGDNESLYFKLGDALEFALLREYLSGRNVNDNLTSDQNLSGFFELSPLVIFELDPEILKIGGILEGLGNTEWKYDEMLVSDTPTETETKTANIRNFINREFGSVWADVHIPQLVKARLAAMLDRTDLTTEEESLTWHENHTDPSASYGETGSARTRDRFSKQAISALLGIPFEFLTGDTVKGYFGARLDHILEKEEFVGLPENVEEILKLGLMTELYVNNDFGLAAVFLQDFAKDEGEDTKRAKTYRGQIAAVLNLGTIRDEKDNPLFKALLFGNGWVTGYEGDVQMGGGLGAVLGSDVIKDISGLVHTLFDQDSSKTGSRVELGDESWNEDTRIRSFLERKGFNNIPVGMIGGKNDYGFALIAYGGVGKALGMDGKVMTERFGELSAILDTPALALIVSGYYADLALERQWGMRFRADIKKGLLRGFAGAIEFNQSRYLATDELERELAVALEIPFGADEDDKDDE